MTDPMNTESQGRGLSPRQRLAIVSAGVAITLAAVWFSATRDKERTTNAALRANRTAATGAMADMPGMNMSGDGSVELTASQISQFGVTFGSVEDRTLSSSLRATGTVAAPEDRVTTVSTKVAGFVERMYVAATGVPVSRGQPVLELYSADLVAAQEELLLARRADRVVGGATVPGVAAGASDLLGAARRRLALLDVPDAVIEDVLRTGRVHRTIPIYAPASGVVTEKQVVEGQGVSSGVPLLTLSDLSSVWIDVEIREGDAGRLKTGQAVDIDLAALPGRTYKGQIALILPTLDAAARTVRARVEVSNPATALRPGMFANVTVLIPSRRTLTVPSSAVVSTGTRSIVFVDMGGGRLMPHDIEIGATGSDYVEVLAGLEPGQRVVTSAQFLLESESNIAEVMRAMMGQTGSADMKMDMPMPMPPAGTKTVPPPGGK